MANEIGATSHLRDLGTASVPQSLCNETIPLELALSSDLRLTCETLAEQPHC
jgi:hypothetical protein